MMAKTKSQTQVFKGIRTLYTLEKAAKKEGRFVGLDDLSPIERAAIIGKDGRIQWIGPEDRIPVDRIQKDDWDEIDLGGAVVIPALVESHTHLVFAGHRAEEFERRNQGESYQSIAESGGGILSTVRSTRAASEEDLASVATTRAERFVRQGISTIEVKSGYGLSTESEIKMLRAAGRLNRPRVIRTFLGAHAVAPEFSEAEEYVSYLMREALPKVKEAGVAERVDIFVEKGYFPYELARLYLEEARRLGFDIVVHADQLSRSRGADLAVEMGARSAEHLIRINDSDIEKLAASEVSCVLLPSADLYMKCAYPPARELIDRGARVALATDFNPGSSPSQDVALVGVLARIEMKMTLAEVLTAYTLGAAFALGMGHELGAILPGRYCDLCVLEGDLNDVFLEIGRMPVRQVYKEGVALL